jgi:hypothetical protein
MMLATAIATAVALGLRKVGWLAPGVPEETFLYAATVLSFCVLFKFSSVAGYHAAEHQTVHAIEAGENLTVDALQRMPRVHPRCGTNLVVGLSIASLLQQPLGPFALIAAVVWWRSLGGVAQHWVTTRRATERQLRSGIAAGEELLERYSADPARRVNGLQRWMNVGLPQMTLGFALCVAVVELAYRLAPAGPVQAWLGYLSLWSGRTL